MSEKVELFGGRGEFELELDFSWRSSRALEDCCKSWFILKSQEWVPWLVFKDLNVMDDIARLVAAVISQYIQILNYAVHLKLI